MNTTTTLPKATEATRQAWLVKQKQTYRIRRLIRERQMIQQLIEDTEQMLKYDPYPEDKPRLGEQLAELNYDLGTLNNEYVKWTSLN